MSPTKPGAKPKKKKEKNGQKQESCFWKGFHILASTRGLCIPSLLAPGSEVARLLRSLKERKTTFRSASGFSLGKLRRPDQRAQVGVDSVLGLEVKS